MNRLTVINVICLGICFFVAVKAQVTADDITPRHTTVEKPREDAILGCDVDGVTSFDLTWHHSGEPIVDDGQKYIIHTNNHTLTIHKVVEGDEGEYICSLKLNNGEEFNTTVYLNMVPQVTSFPKSKNIIQGDPLQMECKAYGYPVPSISWLKEELSLDLSDPRIKVSNHTTDKGVFLANASVRMENLDFSDRAEYSCVATNRFGSNNATLLVRVKDKLAALWPFLGICAEVAILCLIIFIYEKRRAKKMEEEERREEADHLTNSHAHRGNDDIRQRK